MIKRVISGGQTGADRAALDAAIQYGIEYGGAIPKGRRTESGPLPPHYRMEELGSPSYPVRTEKNVVDSDATVIFSHGVLTSGSLLTRNLALRHKKPHLHLDLLQMDRIQAAERLWRFFIHTRAEVVNIAGPRASGDSRIYVAVYAVLQEFFRLALTNEP